MPNVKKLVISPAMLAELLQLPEASVVSGNVTVLVAHPGFPDVPEGAEIPDMDVECVRTAWGRFRIVYPEMK